MTKIYYQLEVVTYDYNFDIKAGNVLFTSENFNDVVADFELLAKVYTSDYKHNKNLNKGILINVYENDKFNQCIKEFNCKNYRMWWFKNG